MQCVLILRHAVPGVGVRAARRAPAKFSLCALGRRFIIAASARHLFRPCRLK